MKDFLNAASPEDVLHYVALTEGVLVEMGRSAADAVQGMKPVLTTWNNNSASSQSNPVMDTMKYVPQLAKVVSPEFTHFFFYCRHDKVFEQTGVKPPSWLMDTTNISSGVKPPPHHD